MRHGSRLALLGLGLMVAGVNPAKAQGYRLMIDARGQYIAYRGWEEDSILAADAVPGPNGGPETSSGFGVNCSGGGVYCYYLRPGPRQQAAPLVGTADLTMWRLGLPGLSLHFNGRANINAGDATWPGMPPDFQLWEGYLDYQYRWLGLRAGRQNIVSRLGWTDVDGGRVGVALNQIGLTAAGYYGWGLAQSSALPINNERVQPLGDFQPSERQIVAGGLLTWTSRAADLRFDWLRQVDGSTRNLLSDQLAISGSLRPARQWTLTGGGAYDLAQALWGTADLSLRFAARPVNAAVTLRRYVPHFDLYSVWTAFSPVPYKGIYGSATVTPWEGIQLRGRAEYYKYDDAEAATPLVSIRQDGWRWTLGATVLKVRHWTFDGGYTYQVNPGASAWGVDGTVGFQPVPALTLRAFGSTLKRPLEYRYEDALVQSIGFNLDWRVRDNLQLGAIVNEMFEQRRRPDSSGFDWSQTQLSARVTMYFASGSPDRLGLPQAVVRMPSGVGIVK